MFLLRLDDACPYMYVVKWCRVEEILDKYGVKPIVAVIPDCQDKMFTEAYEKDDGFWGKAKAWQEKGWTIALHGYNHVYTNIHAKGLNPINNFSEFVGLSLEDQRKKINDGMAILESHGLTPTCFVAPAHSFDENTVTAIKNVTDIRVISDTIANDVYIKNGIYYMPQQCGNIRNLKFRTTTFCYHPNTMNEDDLLKFDRALSRYSGEFTAVSQLDFKNRKFGVSDYLIRTMYFLRRKIRYE